MLVVGLTGGIGSGKSTVAALLMERGAHVIDADLLGREALRPGEPAWHKVVGQFGEEILAPTTLEVDRRRLAEIVFNDHEALAALNAIVHPVILNGIADRLEGLRHEEGIVVLDAALIVEFGLEEIVDVLVAVVAEPGRRKERLVRERAMDPVDVDARMGAQADPAEVEAKADIVIKNDGSLESLTERIEKLWKDLESRKNDP